MRLRTALELIGAMVVSAFVLTILLIVPKFLGVDFHNIGITIVIILTAYVVGDLLAFRLARGGRGIFLHVINSRIMTESRAFITYYIIIVILSLLVGWLSVWVGGLLDAGTNKFIMAFVVSLVFSIMVWIDLRLRYYYH